jgi:hypothetical protein
MINQPKKYLYATQPLTLWGVWNNSFFLLKNSFSKIWYLAIIPTFFQLLYFPALKLMLRTGSRVLGFAFQPGFLGVVIFLVFGLSVLYIISLIIYRMHVATFENENITLKDCLWYVFERFGSILLAILILVGVIFGLILIGVLIILGAKHFYPRSVFIDLVSVLILCLGFYGCFYYTIFSNVFILLEKQTAWQAIKSSYYLVKNHFWRTLFVIVFPFFVIKFVVISVFMIFSLDPLVFTSAVPIYFIGVSLSIVGLLLLIYLLYLPSLLLVQFFDLKNRQREKLESTVIKIA